MGLPHPLDEPRWRARSQASLARIISIVAEGARCGACLAACTSLPIDEVLETLERADRVQAITKAVEECAGCGAVRPVYR